MEPAEFLRQHSDELPLYNAAQQAVTESEEHLFAEAEKISDLEQKIKVYARIATNHVPEIMAARIRRRAERRFRQMRRALLHHPA
jgi:hypothetical protein